MVNYRNEDNKQCVVNYSIITLFVHLQLKFNEMQPAVSVGQKPGGHFLEAPLSMGCYTEKKSQVWKHNASLGKKSHSHEYE